jgi:geranylgeranyl diphosphate synthase type I
MGREPVAGECLEILRTGRFSGLAQSLAIVRFKTGSCTVERAVYPVRS